MVRTPQSTLMIKCCVLVLSQQNKQLRNNMNGKILDLHIMRKWNHIQKGQKHIPNMISFTHCSRVAVVYSLFFFVRWTFSFCVVCQRARIKWTIPYFVCLCYTVTTEWLLICRAYELQFNFFRLRQHNGNREKSKKNVLTLIWNFLNENVTHHITCLFAYYREEDIKIWLKQTHQIDQLNFASFLFVIFYLYISFSFRTFLLCFKFLKPIGG